jgi:hypothetical protein
MPGKSALRAGRRAWPGQIQTGKSGGRLRPLPYRSGSTPCHPPNSNQTPQPKPGTTQSVTRLARTLNHRGWRACHCSCGTAHPDNKNVCGGRAAVARCNGEEDVYLRAPCAAAQGVTGMRR